MKKFKVIIYIISLIILLDTVQAGATPIAFSGGVSDDYQYEEMVFVTGQPIKFVGQCKISDRMNGDKRTITYTFSNLKPEDASISGNISRTVTYTTQYVSDDDKGQTITNSTIKINETITVGKDKYTLMTNVPFSKSDTVDNRPVADFYSGNIQMRQYYYINGSASKNEGTVEVDISGTDYGYQNFWGNTETQMLDYTIHYNRDVVVDAEANPVEKQKIEWTGTVNAKVSDSSVSSLNYASNEANLASFTGGYVKVTNHDIVSEYTYDLPKMVESDVGYTMIDSSIGAPDEDGKRNHGSVQLQKDALPKVESLIVPKLRDVAGYWAQEYIEKLYSLDVYDGNSDFFTPEIPMTRQEFTRAVVKACDIRTSPAIQKVAVRGKTVNEVSPFVDVGVKDPDYQYIKDALQKGIIKGSTQGAFGPSEPLTRAQAITILIRAIGFENKAPNPGYRTTFSDDDQIPNWAKDCIYVAAEIGLIQGDEGGNVNAENVMSRAEASVMLVHFLEFLQKDLQTDYRENIINYN